MDKNDDVTIAFINWIDAHMVSELEDVRYHDGVPGIVCGILLDVTDKAVMVGLQLFDDLDARQILTIPKKMITRMSIWKLGKFEEIINVEQEKESEVPNGAQPSEPSTAPLETPAAFLNVVEEYTRNHPNF
jgi:hypothetical protein